MELPVAGTHRTLPAESAVRVYLVCQLPEFLDIASTCLLATEPSGEALEHFTYFAGLEEVVYAEFTDEDAEVIDCAYEPRDLQFEQRFAYDALCNAELPGQLLLSKSFPGLTLPGEDHFLDPAPHAVPC